MSDALLSVNELTVAFRDHSREIVAVDRVSFSCDRGQVVGLVGESGCGKSTTAMAIPGLLPSQAEVRCSGITFDNQRIDGLSHKALRNLRGMRIGVVFQDPMSSLNPYLRVGTQVTEHIRLHLGLSKRDANKRAIALLERVGIPQPAEALSRYPHQFSGGQRQRVMIAIALACDPELLIADEPTTALDVTIQADILDLIKDLQRERDLAMLLISHDLGVIAGSCDHVCVMDAGRIVEAKPVDDLFANPQSDMCKRLLAAVPVIPEKKNNSSAEDAKERGENT